MVKDGQLCYESGGPIEMEDRVHVIAPNGESFILHLTKFVAGISIINGEPKPEYAIGFYHKDSGQNFQPEQLQDCKIYEVIDIETGENNEKSI